MSLVSAVILGAQTHEPSHQIRDHLQPILEGTTCFASLRKYRLNTSAYRLLGWACRRNRQNNSEHAGRWRPLGWFFFGHSYSGGGTSEYSTRLRATERISREVTTALGKQAARATVGVLG